MDHAQAKTSPSVDDLWQKLPPWWAMLLGAVAFVGTAIVLADVFPFGPDWREAYRQAALEFIAGRNPHDIFPYFNNPFWVLLIIAPMAVFPMELGGAMFLLVSMLGFCVAIYRLGASPLTMGIFLGSPPVLHCLLNGNIDWIPLLGFSMAPQIGLFFVVTKPQIGTFIALFWLVESYRKGGWREVVRVFAPVTSAFLVSFVLYGFWFLKWQNHTDQWWNASLFPYSVPLGIVLAGWSLYKRDMRWAMPASPMIAPYVLFHSWSTGLMALATKPKWMAAVVGIMWAFVIAQLVS